MNWDRSVRALEHSRPILATCIDTLESRKNKISQFIVCHLDFVLFVASFSRVKRVTTSYFYVKMNKKKLYSYIFYKIL